MKNENIGEGYIKKQYTFLVNTRVGDKWKSDRCEFEETKNGTVIVDLKETKE